MTSLAALPSFLAYFIGSLALLGLFLLAHAKTLHIPEWTLVRQGNVAAALSVSGSALGFAMPLASAIVHSANFVDMLVWAVVSAVAQLLGLVALRLLRPDFREALVRGDMAEATIIAVASTIIGLLDAACLS